MIPRRLSATRFQRLAKRGVFLPSVRASELEFSNFKHLSLALRIHTKRSRSAAVWKASSQEPFATVTQVLPEPALEANEEPSLTCPVCMGTEFALEDTRKPSLQCTSCGRKLKKEGPFFDLTVTSGLDAIKYQERNPVTVQTFRNPLLSFAYERGYRQQFRSYGYPGPDEEAKMALAYLKPVWGGTVIDLSCGSGLFTRRLAKSGKFEKIVALDFSESMLRQT